MVAVTPRASAQSKIYAELPQEPAPVSDVCHWSPASPARNQADTQSCTLAFNSAARLPDTPWSCSTSNCCRRPQGMVLQRPCEIKPCHSTAKVGLGHICESALKQFEIINVTVFRRLEADISDRPACSSFTLLGRSPVAGGRHARSSPLSRIRPEAFSHVDQRTRTGEIRKENRRYALPRQRFPRRQWRTCRARPGNWSGTRCR